MENYDIEIISKIGEGGYGEIFKAIINNLTENQKNILNTKDDFKYVAIKIIKNEKYSLDILNEFFIINLNHPNIIKFYDIVLTDDDFFIIMELYENSISNYYYSNNKLDKKQKINIVNSLWNGLSYLHKNNILHEDLKPDNIMLNNNFQEAVIIDYGISVFNFCDKKYNNETLGPTYGYAPIDKMLNRVLNHGFEYSKPCINDDMWGFVLCVFFIFTGQNLFDMTGIKSLTQDIMIFLDDKKPSSSLYYNDIYDEITIEERNNFHKNLENKMSSLTDSEKNYINDLFDIIKNKNYYLYCDDKLFYKINDFMKTYNKNNCILKLKNLEVPINLTLEDLANSFAAFVKL